LGWEVTDERKIDWPKPTTNDGLSRPGERSRMPFEHEPVLKGDPVELRPLRLEDYDDLYGVAADPLIWDQHPVKNRHEEGSFRAHPDGWEG
jgi:hypothetical protein